jgi:hypothetical protein
MLYDWPLLAIHQLPLETFFWRCSCGNKCHLLQKRVKIGSVPSCCHVFFPVTLRRSETVKIGSVTSESLLLPRLFPAAPSMATKVKIGSVTSESFLLPRVFPVATRRAVATARSEKPTSRPDLVHSLV